MGCWWMLLCELDGRVLGGMGHAVWGAGGCCFASLTAGCQGACSLGCWWVLLCEFDGRVLGGMQFGMLVGAALRA